MKYEDFFREFYPIIDELQHHYPAGINPGAKYGDRETVAGSFVNWGSGSPADVVAMSLEVEEQDLIDMINGLYKRDIRREYYSYIRYPFLLEQRAREAERRAKAAAKQALKEFFELEDDDIKYRFSRTG